MHKIRLKNVDNNQQKLVKKKKMCIIHLDNGKDEDKIPSSDIFAFEVGIYFALYSIYLIKI